MKNQVEKTEITRSELKEILAGYGHHMNVTVPVALPKNRQYTDHDGEWVTSEWFSVLNNGTVYNPYFGGPGRLGSNEQNADSAMKFIKDEVKIYSNVFQFKNGHYIIID